MDAGGSSDSNAGAKLDSRGLAEMANIAILVQNHRERQADFDFLCRAWQGFATNLVHENARLRDRIYKIENPLSTFTQTFGEYIKENLPVNEDDVLDIGFKADGKNAADDTKSEGKSAAADDTKSEGKSAADDTKSEGKNASAADTKSEGKNARKNAAAVDATDKSEVEDGGRMLREEC